ncbi:MAG: DUF4870 family protein [Gammaproteobacteria bacterium]
MTDPRPADSPLVGYTHIVYALHALSVVIALTTAATIIGSFIFGIPSIIAVIMNYVRRRDVAGTWLESHFRWQIRTFWGALWATVLVAVVSAPLMLLLVGFLTLPVGIAVISVWIMYRVIRGWLALREGRSMPMDGTPVARA